MKTTLSKNTWLRFIVEAAIMIALGTVLSEIPIPFLVMPLGGKATLASVLPLSIIAYRHGILKGFIASFVYSLIQLALGAENLAYGTTWYMVLAILFLDYVIAYAVYGFVALFRGFGKGRISNTVSFSLGLVLASVLRFACHYVTGFSIWGQWAPEGMTQYYYSLVYNAQYMVPDMLIAIGVGIALSLALDFKKDNLLYKK